MNTFLVMLALSAVIAAVASVWVTVTFLNHERSLRRQKAIVVRAQLLGFLGALREVLVPRSRPLEPGQKEVFEPLQFLWVQADRLDPEEIRAINQCGTFLMALRHKPSLNHTQVRVAQRLIDESCVLLEKAQRKATLPLTVEETSWLGPMQAVLPAWLTGYDHRNRHEPARLPTPSGVREP